MKQKHRFKIDQLIRDNLLEIMSGQGITVKNRTLNHEEYLKSLKDKLIIEAQEVCSASTPKDLNEELADVLEIIISLASLNNVTLNEIMQLADKKRSAKGSFNKQIYADFVEIEEDNPAIDYYRARPDQYPEIL